MKPCIGKIISVLAVLWFLIPTAAAQTIIKEFNPQYFSTDDFQVIREAVGRNKVIPPLYEKQILLALSYFPELANTSIEFRIKPAYTPLSTRPCWTCVVKKKEDRKYIITISDRTMSELMPILLMKMNFNAQVGVIGHELSHVADFNSKRSLGLFRVGLGNLSQKFLDRFEYRTDSICIVHGLGYQLLSWSIFVRKTMHHENWEGAGNVTDPTMGRERYMNPTTIRRRINADLHYKNTL